MNAWDGGRSQKNKKIKVLWVINISYLYSYDPILSPIHFGLNRKTQKTISALRSFKMKVMAFNGSPRKKEWNTITLLEQALEGAASEGAETELVQLYDLSFSGCISCFTCKKLDRKKDGVCAIQDNLTSVLSRVRDADALILGTPVYLGAESASMRAFMERLLYPYLKYSKDHSSLFPRRINTAIIYTMNVPEEMLVQIGFDRHFDIMARMVGTLFGACELLFSTDTLQYDDYDKYESAMFDKVAKAKRHAEVFPEDCKLAFSLGVRMASGKVPEPRPLFP